MNKRQKEELVSILRGPIQWDGSMKKYTSFSAGGIAEAVVKVETLEELQQLLCFFIKEAMSWRVVGKGTNTLVRDQGFAGVIILLAGDFKAIRENDPTTKDAVLLQVGCGCGFGSLGRYCIENGISGMEFTTGIPGSLGGAVMMNAGAWGKDMASVLQKVSLLTCDGLEQLELDELNFVYRGWPGYERYKDRAVIVEAEVELKRGEPFSIKAECQRLLDKRRLKQPLHFAHAGSFFKNPPGDSAGRLIDASGLKGLTVGGAMVSEQHANFLVNTGQATAKDILGLMKMVQEKVVRDSGIDLVPEIHII